MNAHLQMFANLTRQQVAVVCWGLIHEGKIPKTSTVKAIGDVLNKQDDDVRGNRAETADYTFADGRLAMAATLRHCLELLEGVQTK
jgi:hypothetical protein